MGSDKGAAIITAVLFFVVITTALALGLSSPVVREYRTARDFEKSKGAYYLTEAGHEDVLYRLRQNKQVGVEEVLSLEGSTATTTLTVLSGSSKLINSIGDILRNTRRVRSVLSTSSGASFHYGVQAGDGGVLLQNSSMITGNLYSSGPVCGGGSSGATCSGGGNSNIITGTIISSSSTAPYGVIARVQNQGGNSMYAGMIKNATVSGVAYCNTISSSSTNTCEPLPTLIPDELPISADQIAGWEAAAEAGGSVVCTAGKYTISTSMTIGPKKIPCDLELAGAGSGNGPTITLNGPVWVTGNIDIKNYMTVRVNPLLVGQSMVVIADNPANRLTSSEIGVESNVPRFQGAPGGNSWILLLSENMSAATGGDSEAIELENGAQGDLILYARLGDILLKNSSAVNEVTGYRITLQNTANVAYAAGLQSTLFTSGPGGSWLIQDWGETY